MNNQALPFSQACENNKAPILSVIKEWYIPGQTILEVGSGTAQHSVYFAENLPDIVWQTADQKIHHDTILARVALANRRNLLPPLDLEALVFDWSQVEFDGAFSANTAHIMSWSAVVAMFRGIGRQLKDGVFILYGPFNRNGVFTSSSNQQFDNHLRRANPEMGIRDDRALIEVGLECGLELVNDIDMPANNRILIWRQAV